MLGALIIVFREVIEAGIIVGIVMAVTQGTPRQPADGGVGVAGGRRSARRWSPPSPSALADALQRRRPGIVQRARSSRSPSACSPGTTSGWRATGASWPPKRAKLGQEVRSGARSLAALAIVVAVAVMREGSEIALFLYGLVAAGGTTARDLLIGSLLGLVAGAAVSAVTYFGLVTIPARHLFA